MWPPRVSQRRPFGLPDIPLPLISPQLRTCLVGHSPAQLVLLAELQPGTGPFPSALLASGHPQGDGLAFPGRHTAGLPPLPLWPLGSHFPNKLGDPYFAVMSCFLGVKEMSTN